MINERLIIANICEVADVTVEEWQANTAIGAELRTIVVRWLYHYGMSEREIARMFGWSQQRVSLRKNYRKESRRMKAIAEAFAVKMSQA